jgi:dTMP kinase
MSLLIALEGIDTNNKNSLINSLKESNELNIITCNWKRTQLGEKIAELLNEANNEELNLLALEELARKKIRPNLKENKIVIVDDYIDNILVYQGFEEGRGIDAIEKIVEKNIKLELPDITFILDVDLQKIQKNLDIKWDNSKLEFYQRIREYYLNLKIFFPERIYILSAHKNQKEILEEIKSIIKKFSIEEENKKKLPAFSLVIVRDKKWGWNLPSGKIDHGENPDAAACREVFEETNLVIEKPQKIGEKVVFFANLPTGKQHWLGYFFQTDEYSGEIKNKGDVEEIKFADICSNEEMKEKNYSSYQFYLKKIKKFNYSRYL